MGRTTAIIAGTVLAALLLLLLLVPALIDWSRYKGEVVGHLERALGRSVDIAGPLSLRLLPTPSLTAERVAVANLPGAEPQDMATVDRLGLRLALLPLLGGRVVVDSLVLDHPQIHLQRLADGRANWQFHSAEAPAPGAPAEAGPAPHPADGGGGNAVRIESLEVRDGLVIWQSGAQPPVRIEAVDGRVAAPSASGPFEAKASARVQGIAVNFDARLGSLSSVQPAPASLALALPSAGARLDLSGSIAQLQSRSQFTGRLAFSADTPERLPGLALPRGPLTGEAQVAATADEMSLTDLAVSVGPIRATGEAAAAFDGVPRVDLALTIASLDLDAWPVRAPDKAGPSAAPVPQEVPPAPGAAPTAAGAGFRLPSGLFVDARLAVDTLSWRGQVVRNARVDATLDQGELVISRAGADLPGGSTVAGEGTLAVRDGRPAFDGRVQASSADLRALLGWLGTTVEGVAADRLHRFSAAAAIAATPGAVALNNLDLAVDSVRAAGSATIGTGGARPSYRLALAVDSLDLDSYLPARRADVTASPQSPAGAAGAPSGKPAPAAAGGGIDAGFDIVFRRLLLRRAEIDQVRLTGSFDGSAVDLRAESGGLNVTATGAVAWPVNLAVTAHADDAARALRPFVSGWRPRGALALAATVAGSGDTVAVSGIDARLGAARLTGTARVDLAAKPRITAELAGNAIDLGPLVGERTGMLQPSRGGRVPAPVPLPVVPAALGGAGGAPWSHEPLNLAVLNDIDARIDFTAEALSWEGWRLDAPRAHLLVEDGGGRLDKLTGRLLGGQMTLDMRLTGGSLPQVTGTLAVAGADLGQLKPGGGIRVTQGRMDSDIRFAASGRSIADMAARLGADGRVTVKDGVLSGFDLPAVNRQLSNLSNLGNLLALAQTGLSGGSTRFSTLAATFHGDKGVVSTHDAHLDAEGGTGAATGTVDLARWTIESRVEFRVAGGSAPPLALRFDGPLDNPRKVVDVNELQRYLVARGLGSGLKGKAGGIEGLLGALGKGGAGGDQQSQQPADKPPSGKDVLKGLLKGLGGR